MIKVAVLNKQQVRDLKDQPFEGKSIFNPVLDIEGNMIITEQEVNQLINMNLDWVNDLELVWHSSILKGFQTKEQWNNYDIAETEKELVKLKEKKDHPNGNNSKTK